MSLGATTLEGLESQSEKPRREETLVTWTILIFLSGILNAIVLVLILNMWEPITSSIVRFAALSVLALTFPVVCSLVMSNLLPQKRFASPFDIGAISVAAILLRPLFFVEYPPYGTSVVGTILTVFGAVYYLVSLRILSDRAARSISGIGYSPPHRHTTAAFFSVQTLRAEIEKDHSLRNALELGKGRRLREEIVIYQNDRSDYRFFIVLVGDPKCNSCQIHFEAYGIGRYAIYTDDKTKRIFNRDTGYFERVLREEKGIEFTDSALELPFSAEIDQILLKPTRSGFLSLTALPNRARATIAGSGFLSLSFCIMYVTGIISFNDFLTTMITTIGPFLLGVFRSLKAPVKRGK